MGFFVEKISKTYYNISMLSQWYSYCLELEDNFYYVGISMNPAHRIYAHKLKEGAVLTKTHEFKNIVGVWNIGILDSTKAKTIENNITECMNYALDGKVRGGSWCSEDSTVHKNGLGWKYLERFPNVTSEVEKKLNLMELRGWG